MIVAADAPTLDVAESLLVRLRHGDPTVTADIAEAYVDHLAWWLWQKHHGLFPAAADEDYLTAAEDALLKFFEAPEKFDSRRANLTSYLRVAANGDFLNLLAREGRHGKRKAEALDAFVELEQDLGNRGWEEVTTPDEVYELRLRREEVAEVLGEVQADLTEKECGVLQLMLDEVRTTSSFAEVLGISAEPENEQFRQVKRAKDKIKQRIKRAYHRRSRENRD